MIKSGVILSTNGTWVTLLTNCGKEIEVNTVTKRITKLNFDRLMQIVKTI